VSPPRTRRPHGSLVRPGVGVGGRCRGRGAQRPHCAAGKQAAGRLRAASSGVEAVGWARRVRVPCHPSGTGTVTPGTMPGTGGAGQMGVVRPWHCSWGARRPLQPFFLQSLPPPKSAALGGTRGCNRAHPAATPAVVPAGVWVRGPSARRCLLGCCDTDSVCSPGVRPSWR